MGSAPGCSAARAEALRHERTAHPVNLAVFRMAVFVGHLFVLCQANPLWFATLPRDFVVPPAGLEGVLEVVPIDPAVMGAAMALYVLLCLSAIVGFRSRTCAGLATLLALYVLGVPNFFGKVNHYHHLLWFGAILSTCRCGDALAIDALIAARGRREGAPVPCQAARAYGQPLRYVWVLIGLIYFFPGLWKLVNGGLEWISAESFRNLLYQSWAVRDGWRPLVRVDRWPLVPSALAAFTIAFELSFVFLIAHPRSRRIAAIAGLLFHNGAWLLMNIPFAALQICYVAFFDVHSGLQRLRRWGSEGEGRTTREGNEDVGRASSALSPATTLVGGLLVAAVLATGFVGLSFAWPISCYPTFAEIARRERSVLRVYAVDEARHEAPVDLSRTRELFGPERFSRLAWRLSTLEDEGSRSHMLGQLWAVLETAQPELDAVRRVRFYREVIDVRPDSPPAAKRRELLAELARRCGELAGLQDEGRAQLAAGVAPPQAAGHCASSSSAIATS